MYKRFESHRGRGGVQAYPHTQGEPTQKRLPKVNIIVIVLPIVVVLVALSLRGVKEYDRGVIFEPFMTAVQEAIKMIGGDGAA